MFQVAYTKFQTDYTKFCPNYRRLQGGDAGAEEANSAFGGIEGYFLGQIIIKLYSAVGRPGPRGQRLF